MTKEASKIVYAVLRVILSEHQIGKSDEFHIEIPLKRLLDNAKVDQDQISSVVDHLIEKGIIYSTSSFCSEDEYDEAFYSMGFPEEFRKNAERYLNHISGSDLEIIKDIEKIDVTVERQIGQLASMSDGTITYKNKQIEMRPQIRDLCRYFISNEGVLLNADDIKDTIISSHKRDSISEKTIAKYVHELHLILRDCFNKEVISNSKLGGWTFNVDL